MFLINTLRPRQIAANSHTTFSNAFSSKKWWISLKISLKFAPKFRINNIPVLVQIVAWRRPGDRPLSGPMTVYLTYAYMLTDTYASLGLSELKSIHAKETSTLAVLISIWIGWVNILKHGRNRRHSAGDIFKCVLFKTHVSIPRFGWYHVLKVSGDSDTVNITNFSILVFIAMFCCVNNTIEANNYGTWTSHLNISCPSVMTMNINAGFVRCWANAWRIRLGCEVPICNLARINTLRPNEMTGILRTTLWNAFPRQKIYCVEIKFHCS